MCKRIEEDPNQLHGYYPIFQDNLIHVLKHLMFLFLFILLLWQKTP